MFADKQETPINSVYYVDEADVPVDTLFNHSDTLENVIEVIFDSQYRISEEGKQFIIKYEKCHLESYKDLGGGYTIGYGHHTKEVKRGMKISQKQAEAFFDEDIKKIEKYAIMLIENLPYKYRFSQEFFDGLCDLVYNAGPGAVQRSEFYKRLKNCRVTNNKMNKEDYEYTISAVKFLNAPYKGHKIRRQECHDNMIRKF
ncbi:MAG: lysozyme [Erysipelotrichales bacterium]|nr:lysozyme [Erysipelotrichales bacterium]